MLTRTALLLGALALPASPGAANAADIPGDRGTSATIPLSREKTEGEFDAEGDSDWYRVALKRGQTYAVGVEVPSNAAVINLRDARGRKVEGLTLPADGGRGGFEVQPAASGTYFLELTDRGGFGYPAPFEAAISTDCRGDAATACTLAPGQTRAPFLDWPSDIDYFKVKLEKGALYDIIVKYYAGLFVKVLDARGRVVAERAPPGEAPSIVGLKVPRTGTYFVAVTEGGGTIRSYGYEITLERVRGARAAAAGLRP